ncbi:MAG: UDP-4-amino-4,6-dideoxy-N-acetyl-beta-L-altrosamine transaminase [Pseudomonadota bacterium]
MNDLKTIPYGKQWIDEDDIRAVVDVLRADRITTGPRVKEFEREFSRAAGSRFAVAVSSGTAALHCAMYALGIGPGDEVIVPAMTFAATANCVVFQGGTPVFADIDPLTLLIDPDDVEAKFTPRTKAVIAVDYAGQPCRYDELRGLTSSWGIPLVADACHSLGAAYYGRPVGSLADLSVFSFHPVKHITTGEGGMITTDDPDRAEKAALFRNHGITVDFDRRLAGSSWFYEIVDLGYNYRITDIQCALGISQLKKLAAWTARRREIADRYSRALMSIPQMAPLDVMKEAFHSYHLYVVKIGSDEPGRNRDDVFAALLQRGILVNVHYIPVHLHPYYRKRFGTAEGLCPKAEAAYRQVISLPMFPLMSDADVDRVMETCAAIMKD